MEDSVVLEDTREKSVSSDLIRGHINTIILRALYDGDKYGYEIIAEIEQKSHGQYSLKQPSLYSALKRLEKDGYVTSYWGGSVSGGRRKYFSLTEAGKTISEQNQAEWEYSRTVIDSLISDKDFDFSNPAPTAVNMRVLKETTSRVPRGEGGDDELDYEPSFDDTEELGKLEARYREQLQELDEKRSELDSRKQAFEEEMRSRNEAIMRERDWRESEIAAREQSLAQKRAELEQLRAEQKAQAEQQAEIAAQQAEQAARAESEQAEELRNRISSLEYELKESEAALEAARRQNEAQAEEDRVRAEALFGDERHTYDEQIKALETERDEERARYDEQLKVIEADRENERRSYDERIKEAEDNLANERSTFNDQLNQALAEERAVMLKKCASRNSVLLRNRKSYSESANSSFCIATIWILSIPLLQKNRRMTTIITRQRLRTHSRKKNKPLSLRIIVPLSTDCIQTLFPGNLLPHLRQKTTRVPLTELTSPIWKPVPHRTESAFRQQEARHKKNRNPLVSCTRVRRFS